MTVPGTIRPLRFITLPSRVKWRSGWAVGTVYGFLGVGVWSAAFATAGLVGLMPLVDENGDAESRITSAILLIVGVLFMGGAIRVLRRNYVRIDEKSRIIHVVTAGELVCVTFDEARFAIPPWSFNTKASVSLRFGRDGRLHCGLLSQGSWSYSRTLKRFTRHLNEVGIQWAEGT